MKNYGDCRARIASKWAISFVWERRPWCKLDKPTKLDAANAILKSK